MIAGLVYMLCTLTSLACSVALMRAYSKSKVRMLFWSGLGFIALTVNNILLFVDLVMVPTVDISQLRILTGLLGVAVIVYGLVRETA